MSNTAEDQAWRRANRIANGRCGRCNEPRAFNTTMCRRHLANQWYLKRRQHVRKAKEGT